MKPARAVVFVAALLCVQSAPAQQGDGWAGEWGEFHKIPAVPADPPQGAALTISGCSGETCKISALTRGNSGSHCEADGKITITSPGEATAHFMAFGQEKCSLTLLRDQGSPATISAEPGSGDCASYYCTPGGGLTQKFAFRSAAIFTGDDKAGCFAEPSPALAAICSNPKLADLQKQWQSLAWRVADLGPTQLDEQDEQKKLLASCDSSADAPACLDKAFHGSMEQMNERKSEWLTSVTMPGNEKEAAEKSQAISGRYMHSFHNGDVQGDSFRSTDILNIVRLNGDGISYSVDLNFFNGHACSRKGVATYRKGGFFVDQTKSLNNQACYFEIIPTEDGVKLGDPTGACRQTDCGARGGYTDIGFSFREKVQQFSK